MAKKPLHDILSEIVGEDRCYFEPPASVQMKYPCIRYEYSNDQDTFADNRNYFHSRRYTVTVIDYSPDSKIPDKLRELTYCSSDRNYAIDGLSHYVFTLFYNGPRIKEESKNG